MELLQPVPLPTIVLFINSGVTDSFHKCLDHALSALAQRPLISHLGRDIMTGLRSGAVLICGSGTGAGIGCGKTSFAHAVCQQLQQWPVCAHVTLVDCIPFRGTVKPCLSAIPVYTATLLLWPLYASQAKVQSAIFLFKESLYATRLIQPDFCSPLVTR